MTYFHACDLVAILSTLRHSRSWLAVRLVREDGSAVSLGFALEMLGAPMIGRSYVDCTGARVVELRY